MCAGINILAGSTLGGGTRVNWQASFRTADHVRREWAEKHGLPSFVGKQFDAALDAVCTRMGVTTGEHCGCTGLPLIHEIILTVVPLEVVAGETYLHFCFHKVEVSCAHFVAYYICVDKAWASHIY